MLNGLIGDLPLRITKNLFVSRSLLCEYLCMFFMMKDSVFRRSFMVHCNFDKAAITRRIQEKRIRPFDQEFFILSEIGNLQMICNLVSCG